MDFRELAVALLRKIYQRRAQKNRQLTVKGETEQQQEPLEIVKQHGGRPRAEVDQEEIFRLNQAGMSNVKIGKKLGVGEATIRRRLKEYKEQHSKF